MKNFINMMSWLLPSALLVGMGATPVLAQSVSIAPLVVEAEAHRGQSSTTITITNTDTEPFRAKVYPLDFVYNKETGFEIVRQHAKSAIPYLQISDKEIEIPAGSTRKIRVSVTMPPSVPDGEYRTVLYIEDLKERTVVDAKGVETQVKVRVGSQIFIRKTDGQVAIMPQLKIGNATWNPKSQDIQLLFQNQGLGTAYAATNWQLKQSGKSIANGRVDGTVILGNSERMGGINIGNLGQTGLPPGEYQLSGNITYKVRGDRSDSIPFDVKITIPNPDRNTAQQENLTPAQPEVAKEVAPPKPEVARPATAGKPEVAKEVTPAKPSAPVTSTKPDPTQQPTNAPPSSVAKQEVTPAPVQPEVAKPTAPAIPKPIPSNVVVPGITEIAPVPGITE